MKFSLILFFFLFALFNSIDGQKLKDEDCKCRSAISKRIVGGNEVSENSLPWQVSLALNGNHMCGGTIINHQFIMTSAHCVANLNFYQISQLAIRVGLHYLNDPQIKAKTYLASRIFYDSRFDLGKQIGDFALIEVKGSIPFSKQVQPACLSNEFEDYNDKKAALFAYGWGSINQVITTPDGLVTANKLSNVLKGAYFNYIECDKYLICIKPVKKFDSICFGDSGSGLIHQKPDTPYTRVVGIAQFVIGYSDEYGFTTLCTGNGAYARVSYYIPIIQSIVKNNYCRI